MYVHIHSHCSKTDNLVALLWDALAKIGFCQVSNNCKRVQPLTLPVDDWCETSVRAHCLLSGCSVQAAALWFLVTNSYCKELALNPFAIFLAPSVLPLTHVRSSDLCLSLPSRAPNLWCHQTTSSHDLSCVLIPVYFQFGSYRYSRAGPIPALRGELRMIALRE